MSRNKKKVYIYQSRNKINWSFKATKRDSLSFNKLHPTTFCFIFALLSVAIHVQKSTYEWIVLVSIIIQSVVFLFLLSKHMDIV